MSRAAIIGIHARSVEHMDQLRASIACAAPTSCIHLFDGIAFLFARDISNALSNPLGLQRRIPNRHNEAT